MNAHVIRLDALGKRLTEMADIDGANSISTMTRRSGGPESDGEGAARRFRISPRMLDAAGTARSTCATRSCRRCENVILARKLSDEIQPEGRPVARARSPPISASAPIRSTATRPSTRAWISPARRARRWSRSPPASSPGPASAAATASWSRSTTATATSRATRTTSSTLVRSAQTVKRGEPIALMGSTGRSTGPTSFRSAAQRPPGQPADLRRPLSRPHRFAAA